MTDDELEKMAREWETDSEIELDVQSFIALKMMLRTVRDRQRRDELEAACKVVRRHGWPTGHADDVVMLVEEVMTEAQAVRDRQREEDARVCERMAAKSGRGAGRDYDPIECAAAIRAGGSDE